MTSLQNKSQNGIKSSKAHSYVLHDEHIVQTDSVVPVSPLSLRKIIHFLLCAKGSK